MDQAGVGVGALVILALLTGLYLLPGIIASSRGHRQAVAIWLLNILLGWSFIGWVVAIVWAFTNPAEVIAAPSVSAVPARLAQHWPKPDTAELAVQELADVLALRSRGLITTEEYDYRRRKILNLE